MRIKLSKAKGREGQNEGGVCAGMGIQSVSGLTSQEAEHRGPGTERRPDPGRGRGRPGSPRGSGTERSGRCARSEDHSKTIPLAV